MTFFWNVKKEAKRKNRIYQAVDEKIMDARVSLLMKLRGKIPEKQFNEVDEELYRLGISAPNAALTELK